MVEEYLETLDDATFGASTKAIPKYISPIYSAARWTVADSGAAFFAYYTNYMVDLDNAVIVPSRQIALQSPAEQWMSNGRLRSGLPKPLPQGA